MSLHSLNKVTRRAALLVAGLLALPAWAGAPLAKTNAPGFQTQAALAKNFQKAPLETSVNAFLINTGKRLILVDAGAGSLFGPTAAKSGVLVGASHMPFPAVGHLTHTGKSYQWVPVNYTQLR
jgi:hypothetical protein